MYRLFYDIYRRKKINIKREKIKINKKIKQNKTSGLRKYYK